MVKKQILFTLFALLSFTVSAENTLSTVSPDSIKYSIDLDEVEIVSKPIRPCNISPDRSLCLMQRSWRKIMLFQLKTFRRMSQIFTFPITDQNLYRLCIFEALVLV